MWDIGRLTNSGRAAQALLSMALARPYLFDRESGLDRARYPRLLPHAA